MYAFIRIIILIILLAPVSTVLAEGESTGWLKNPDHPFIEVRLSLTGAVDSEAKHVLAILEARLETDWKTYWRSPGEGGIAPFIDWQESQNVAETLWRWPIPQRYHVLDVETIGYQESITFPLQFQVNDWHQPVNLQGIFTMSSCTDICVLTDYPVSLHFIPASLKTQHELHLSYQQALSQVPILLTDAVESPLQVKEAVWQTANNQLYLRLLSQQGFRQPEVFIDSLQEGLTDIQVRSPKLKVQGDQLEVIVDIEHWLGELDLSGKPVQITVADEHFLYEIATTPTLSFGLRSIGGSAEALSWGVLILFSLLGGLVLNVMPCVLPVLGMKLQTILTAPREQKVIRRQFLSSAAGILASFWLLAVGLFALKWSGSAIGWGIQFQSVYFLSFMALVTWLFTLNLAGVFQVRLPGNMGSWVAQQGDQSIAGHFVQGMFATLLATPCSAPFLGTAVGFALTASGFQMFAIFTLLGFGMALPWLLVAAWPRFASLLPKPGRWMQGIRVLFSFMLAATTLWLMLLLRVHFDIYIWLVLFSFFIVLSGILIWRTQGVKGFVVALAFVVLSLFGSVILMVLTAEDLNQQPDWQPLDISRIQDEIAAGHTVFVDVTADWCITCKANEVGVLLQNPVYQALHAEHVVLMQGDWTVPNARVTNYLKLNQRYGVPFNIVYGPSVPEGVVLPVVLTHQVVLDALEQVSAK